MYLLNIAHLLNRKSEGYIYLKIIWPVTEAKKSKISDQAH